jgi:hypothetical protein
MDRKTVATLEETTTENAKRRKQRRHKNLSRALHLTQNSACLQTRRSLSILPTQTSIKDPNGRTNAVPATDGFFKDVSSQTASTRRATSRQKTY